MSTDVYNLRRHVMSNVMTALNHIENAQAALKYALKNERSLTEIERNALYEYGWSDIDIHKVRLANVKKSLLVITSNVTRED